jgi:hypothetical protein
VHEATPGEEATLLRIVNGAHGSITRAAKALGWSRFKVSREVRRLGIITSPADEQDEGGVVPAQQGRDQGSPLAL